MESIELITLILGSSLLLSFLFSLQLFRLGSLSNHEFRTIFKVVDGESDDRGITPYAYRIELAFRQARILSYSVFFVSLSRLIGQKHPAFLVSTVANVLVVIAAFLVLWTVNLVLPRLAGSWMGPRPGSAGIRFTLLIDLLMYPFTRLAVSINGGLDNQFKGETGKDKAAEFEEEIRTLIDEGEKKGLFDEHEGSLFQSLVEFSDTVVREVMTPRLDIVAVEVDSPISELMSKILEGGFSRVPVYQERIDDIVGIVFAKDLLAHWGKSEAEIKVKELLREAYFVPETKKITGLLKEFQVNKNHMAIVVDEYGGVSGLVTIEDLIEEIVGEIRDEYDDETDLLQVLEDGSLKVDARINVEEVEDYFNITIEREDFDTIGGLIFHILGRVPKLDEEIPFGDLVMKVLEVEDRRVGTIHIGRKSRESGGRDVTATHPDSP
jgi:CBS domain containing-hemolysin-like protein